MTTQRRTKRPKSKSPKTKSRSIEIVRQSSLPEYTDDKRLSVYRLLTSACTHLYSKGKLQKEKFAQAAEIFADIAKNDPLFMAHFATWASRQDSKDMKAIAIFFNGLSDADGTPFFQGSKSNKPNLRQVSAALIQRLDPHLAERVLELSCYKFGVPGLLNEGCHFPQTIQKAFLKYLRYREQYLEMMIGIRHAGLSSTMKRMYRMLHASPSDDACAAYGWGVQKDGRKIETLRLPNFNDMSSDQIAASLLESKLSPQIALSILPVDKITSGIAKALLSNATGNQAIILYNWFSRNGFMDVPDIRDLFKDKVKKSTTAIDRIDTLTRSADSSDREEMAKIRSEKRKHVVNVASIGKIFMHIDVSGSMHEAIAVAKDRSAIISECVENPEKNFAWGIFSDDGKRLKLPKEFTKEGFYQALYGIRANGGTDCFALYEEARNFGADVDVFITDGENTHGNTSTIFRRIGYLQKPRVAVIVHLGSESPVLEQMLRSLGIPVVILKPESLVESALVAQSIRNAIVGEIAIIEEIMNTDLPSLPKWWGDVKSSRTPIKKEMVLNARV